MSVSVEIGREYRLSTDLQTYKGEAKTHSLISDVSQLVEGWVLVFFPYFHIVGEDFPLYTHFPNCATTYSSLGEVSQVAGEAASASPS